MLSIKDHKKLPQEPGCYLFKDKEGTILYVGKAKDLKKRVASYFSKKHEDPKTQILVKHIQTIDCFITKNEIEALILENNLIKKHYPRYNIDLKDSRRYAYLHLTQDEWPYIEVARTHEKPGRYFGPFVSGRYRREILKILQRHFRVLTSKPSALKKKSLNKEEYRERLGKAVKLLGGNVNALIRELKSEMKKASGKTHFEHALTLKNQIEALGYLKERQSMEMRRNYDADIVNYVRKGDKVYLLLFNIYRGVLENKQEFEFTYRETFLEEFLLRYYSTQEVPQELILPLEIDSALIEYLEKRRKKAFIASVPKIGAKKALLDLALKNVNISVHGENERVLVLQKALGMSEPPELIECFDISHLRGTHTVASMVVFRKGKPYKSSYRKFRIRQETNGDDFLAMREVVERRYGKSLKETMPMPDLIVIDGGAGQLSSAVKILKDLGLDIPVISLAKKLEEIYVPGRAGVLRLRDNDKGLLLLRALRDEAHRFATSYNRLLRRRAVWGTGSGRAVRGFGGKKKFVGKN